MTKSVSFLKMLAKKAVHMDGTYCKKELALSPVPVSVKKMAH